MAGRADRRRKGGAGDKADTAAFDGRTQHYFDTFTPHYDPQRFVFAIEYLKGRAREDQTLIDIGCGDGATLQLIKNNTVLKKLTGLDVSGKYLDKAKELVGCDVIEGSVLGRAVVDRYRGAFDYCTLGAVLHHLIGKNREESARYAHECLKNSFELLKPGGAMIIFEPAYGPSLLMDAVFWVKKIVGGVVSRRVEVFRRWANLGQPVVSYYTPGQLVSLVERLPGDKIIKKVVEIDSRRMGVIIRRVRMGIIVEKRGAG